MIPIKLTLKNFMSYGEEGATLALDGIHVACLSGDNGNGKSALLDAMTWALWGKTRASSVKAVSEDDLIRQGANDVEVRFEFELSGQRYRVVRKRRRGKAGAQWELTQLDSSGHYAPVGGGSMRETGRQIAQLLSMEYETFLNSAYLQQGRADEFTRQTPDSRKRILAEILGLDRYDALEAKARELWRERAQEAKELEQQIRLLEADIARLPEYQEQRERSRAERAEAEMVLAAQEEVAAGWRDRRIKLDALAGLLENEAARVQRLDTDIRGREEEFRKASAKVRALQATLDQRDSIMKDHASLEQNRRRREQLEPDIREYNAKNSELKTVIGAIDGAERELKAELRWAEERLQQVEQRIKETARVEARLSALTTSLQDEKAVLAEWESAQTEAQAAQDAFGELRARNERLKADLKDLDEVLELLAVPHAVCPVCESDLSGSRHATVVKKQEQKRAGLCEELESLKREGTAQKQRLTAVQERVKILDARRNELTAQRAEHRQATERLEALRGETREAATLRQQVAGIRSQLEKKEFAAPQRIQRKRLESELERLGLSKIEHEAALQRIHQLEPALKRYAELQQAEGSWEQERSNLERLEALIAEKRAELGKEQAKLTELRGQLGRYDEVKRAAQAAEIELAQQRAAAERLRLEETRLSDAIEKCDVASQQRKTRVAEHKRTDEERRLYQELASAFGKKGVQALIIENAIPELQEEANELLARMTDNALQVTFETTRAAKSTGSEIETLDIQITDDAGTRPYELFSGGEGFRVNFAIRIALSRLLARRSGAKLQTLIMDEGFGTQDGKGREKLVEVIDTIKDDFERILVITHVEELKDAFTQRIEVTKDARGSHIHLL